MTVTGPSRRRGLGRLAANLWRLLTDRHYRSVKRLAWFGGRRAFQPFGTTFENRYPAVFACACAQLAGREAPNLLSFGCSTGEEVATLRRYFPDATITGLDINSAAIAAARKRLAGLPGPPVRLAVGDNAAGEAAGSYDAVFCMAVLRDGRLGQTWPDRCDRYLDFADFDRMVGDFARALKPGGVLALRHCNFRFCDSSSAAAFDVVLDKPLPANAKRTPLYDRDNRLLKGAVYGECVFVKR